MHDGNLKNFDVAEMLHLQERQKQTEKMAGRNIRLCHIQLLKNLPLLLCRAGQCDPHKALGGQISTERGSHCHALVYELKT